MSCISCEDVPKRINNLFRDDELKEKFENLTGITIQQNIFICDDCTSILAQSYAFKEKCIQVYTRDIDIVKSVPQKNVKTEIFEEYEEHLLDSCKEDTQPLHEEHLEEEIITESYESDPLRNSHEISHYKSGSNDQYSATNALKIIELQEQNTIIQPEKYLETHSNINSTSESRETDEEVLQQRESGPNRKRTYHVRYSTTEKLKAIELAEQTSNRQAAKLLGIDESCIRKWRPHKDKIIKAESQQLNAAAESSEMECDPVTDGATIEPNPTREVRTRKSYSSGEKLQAIEFAEVAGNRQAAKVYKIDESCIRKWRGQKEMIIEINEERGTKRKPNLRFPEVESRLKAYVCKNLEAGIVLKPSAIKSESLRIAEELNITNFKGTSSYIFKFMERYHFPSTRSKSLTPRIIKKCSNEESGHINIDIL